MAVYVWGWYKDYIPSYIFSILYNYPDYHVKVFVPDRMDHNQARSLDAIRKSVSSQFEVVEEFFIAEHAHCQRYCRWLIPYEHFAECENTYIGDVDFVIVEEEPDILEGHLAHCRKLGLPYSNVTRSPAHSNRLSGLHFFQTEAYYDLMRDTISRNIEQPMIAVDNDERLLYEMVNKSIGLCEDHRYRPHHGYHLGLLRGAKSVSNLSSATLRIWSRYSRKAKPMVKHDIYDVIMRNSQERVGGHLGQLREFVLSCDDR